MNQQKEFIEKCIELRRKITLLPIGEAKKIISTLPFPVQLALLVGLNVTSLEELTTK